MARANMSIDAARRHAAQVARPWVDRLARLGFAAKGLVYLVVGVLAVQVALGRGGQTTDSHGALATLAGRPRGVLLLAIVAVGLFGYALWRVVEAWVDPDGKGTDASGLLTRGGYVAVGIVYAGLALSAMRLIQGHAAGSGQNVEESWTARLLQQPLGRWLVGAVGVAIIGFFVAQVIRAFHGNFPEQVRAGELRGAEATWARRLGSFGLAARGVVFVMIGLFLIQAALKHDPGQAGGLDQALQVLAQQAHGAALLGIVALGLMAYGCYMLLIAWHRRRFVV